MNYLAFAAGALGRTKSSSTRFAREILRGTLDDMGVLQAMARHKNVAGIKNKSNLEALQQRMRANASITDPEGIKLFRGMNRRNQARRGVDMKAGPMGPLP